MNQGQEREQNKCGGRVGTLQKNSDGSLMKYSRAGSTAPNDPFPPLRRASTEDGDILERTSFYEMYDVQRVEHLSRVMMQPAHDSAVLDLKQQLKKKTCATRLVAKYKVSEGFPEGRVYGGRMQSLPSQIRRLICGSLYNDVDIVNCAPTIFLCIMRRMPGWKESESALARYVSHREDFLNEVGKLNRHLKSRGQRKRMFLIVMHGGSHLESKRGKGKFVEKDFDFCDRDEGKRCTTSVPILARLETEMGQIFKTLKSMKRYKSIWKAVKADKKKTNKKGCFISRVWQSHEIQAISALTEYATNKGRRVGALCHDGVMLEGTTPLTPLPSEFLRGAEVFIKRRTGLDLKLIEKPMTPTAADWEFYWGPQALHKIDKPLTKATYILWSEAYKLGLRRQDGNVMAPHKSIPGVYTVLRSYEDHCKIALKHSFVQNGNIPVKSLNDWMKNTSHPCFDFILESEMSTSTISFTNGYFDKETTDFIPWSECEKPPMTCHYYERKFPKTFAGHWDEGGSQTPRAHHTDDWDTLVRTQLQRKPKLAEGGQDEGVQEKLNDVIRWFEIFVGRLLFTARHDRWQCVPYIKGVANTGKSTVGEIIKDMFPKGTVGTFGKEQVFGFETLYKKRCNIVMDLDHKKFHKYMPQADFQNIASGEEVSIAQKNKPARCVNWLPTSMYIGNYFPNYKDTSGALARRLMIFHFDTNMISRDTNIMDRIVNSDQHARVMIRCIKAYKTQLKASNGREIWDMVPKSFHQSRLNFSKKVNKIQEFLESNQVVHKEGAVTTLEDFNSAFTSFMAKKYNIRQGMNVSNSDMDEIKKAGYIPRVKNICKTCGKHCTKAKCGDHYDSKNRRKVTVIDRMLLQDPYYCPAMELEDEGKEVGAKRKRQAE